MQWVEETDPDVAARLKDMAIKMFIGCRGISFGRCDIRMDLRTRELYMLEINPNCGIFYPPGSWGSADYIMSIDPMGHVGMIDMMYKCAVKNHAERQKPVIISYRPGWGYGSYAARDIKEGETIEKHEEQARNLVSLGRVRGEWNALKKRWFAQNAYPVSANVYAMWSNEPEDWRPLNHSCDPNSWLVGLDLKARRLIKRGEPISMDYATFCDEEMEPFTCKCGAPTCRGLIKGDDYKLPHIFETYGLDHISDAIAMKLAASRVVTSLVGNGDNKSTNASDKSPTPLVKEIDGKDVAARLLMGLGDAKSVKVDAATASTTSN
eukprot:GDKI01001811.1.p1 GENE.GDKI01001811.1~~GDKI01001811.1.p1  ORF type:complete len:322 (-),score=75.40 GDKI01001811.1:126-1091(-)